MWRIQRLSNEDYVVLTLSGRLQAEELVELQKAFAAERGGQKLALDLAQVRLVDHEAVTFLACCEAVGATLLNCPAYIREWIASVNTQESTQ